MQGGKRNHPPTAGRAKRGSPCGVGRAVAGWLLGVGLALAGCAAAPIAPPLGQSDADRLTARGQAVTLAELQQGRSLFVGRCASCHILPRPAAYGTDRWPAFIDEMAARAQLSPPQAGAVLRYLLAARDVSR